jgi:hypothetical protein
VFFTQATNDQKRKVLAAPAQKFSDKLASGLVRRHFFSKSEIRTFLLLSGLRSLQLHSAHP